MSGDHLFVLDAVAGTMAARFEFDSAGLKATPDLTSALDTRREADLQDIIANPWVAGGKHFVVVDAKNEQLLHVAFDLQGATPTVVPLAKSATGVGTPSWGVWLD